MSSLSRLPRLARAARLVVCTLVASVAPAVAVAQSPEALARRALASRQPATALEQLAPLVASDTAAYDALWLAAQAQVEVVEYDSVPERRGGGLSTAVRYARRAVKRDSTRAEGRFALARAAGLLARSEDTDPGTRAAMGREAYEQATACLAIDPKHAGCLDALGAWHSTVAQLGAFMRRMAASLTGSDAFERASFEAAERYLLAAVALEPRRIAHRLELGRIYAAQGKSALAAEQFRAAATGDVLDTNDERRRAEASRAVEQR